MALLVAAKVVQKAVDEVKRTLVLGEWTCDAPVEVKHSVNEVCTTSCAHWEDSCLAKEKEKETVSLSL